MDSSFAPCTVRGRGHVPRTLLEKKGDERVAEVERLVCRQQVGAVLSRTVVLILYWKEDEGAWRRGQLVAVS